MANQIRSFFVIDRRDDDGFAMRRVHTGFNIFCLIPAAVLGFRHGLDWDHIAAIADVTGGEIVLPGGKRSRYLELPMLYVFGHLTAIAVLAVLARFITQQMPNWLDPLMERVVGSTLVIIGAWLALFIGKDLLLRRQTRYVSRWGLLLATLSHFLKPRSARAEMVISGRCPPKAAFGLGILHGIGAETGTQVVLLAAVSGGGAGGAVCVLAAFALGLLVSNCAVALGIAAGMLKASQTQIVSAILGLMAAGFSVLIGACLILGTVDSLPGFADCIPLPKFE